MKKIVNDLIKSMAGMNLTLALAESITCGLASHQLNIVKGTSDVFMGSIVCYNESVKKKLLKIDPALIKKYTAESREVTDQLVKNLGKLFEADVYGAITGLATSDGSETKNKPVGTVFISILFRGKLTHQKIKFHGQPLEIKKKACKQLYKMIISEIKK